MSEGLELEEIASIPGGNWLERKQDYNRIIRKLFKKQFLLKFRRFSAIIEIIIALVFYFVLYPLDKVATRDSFDIPTPIVNVTTTPSMDILMMFMISNSSRFGVMPKNARVEALVSYFSMLYLSMTTIKAEYTDSVDNLIKITDGSEYSGLGIYWVNSADEDALVNPKFEVYCQSLLTCPKAEVFKFLRSYCLLQNYLKDTSNSTIGLFVGMNSTFQRYPSRKGEINYDMNFVYMIFIIVPIVVATMPDFETVLDEKDTKVGAFMFLNGCPESAYWIVSFTTPLIIAFFPYFFSSVIFCYWFRMLTVDFSFLLVCSILFVSSHIWFQYFISTFMKTGKSGRSFTIVFLVFDLFFGFVHMLVTLDKGQKGGALQHILSIIPFSCYQLIIASLYENGIGKQRNLGWTTLAEDSIPYPLWIGLMWLVLDNLIYFGLFLLCNACNSRLFGTSLIKWREVFSVKAWRRALQKNKYKGKQVKGVTGKIIEVAHLSKTYKGKNDVVVFDDANFYVDEGEVIVIIGPNGAGKSTLVNILAGAIEPDKGTLKFNGSKKSNRFKMLQNCLGVVFQENIIYQRLSVREHLELFGAIKGISEDNLREAISFFAENLQLTHMLENYAGDLSGGQKRKLCIALALLGNPPMVIMDEPTAGVDVQARQLIWKTIASLKQTTSLVTSHALEEAETVSSRLFIVSDRSIPFCGNSTELRNMYQCGYLLRVDREDGTVGPVLDLVQSFIPSAHISDERKDTICLPVDTSVAKLLQKMNEQKEELGIINFSFAVEQLEDMLLKMLETGEKMIV